MKRVEKVVVVGMDATVWMAAAAIQSSFGRTGVKVRVIELVSQLSDMGCYSALPALDGYHLRVGLDERKVLRACSAVPMAGQRFVDWSGAATPFILGYDRESVNAYLDFTHSWTKGRQEGLRSEFETFSLAAMAARASRVPVEQENEKLRATYGYNLDARAYATLLRQYAFHLGVEGAQAAIGNVEINGERVSAIVLVDGERIEADLFVDASGAEAVLIGRMPGAELESWRQWLPCDRLMVASANVLQPLPSFSQISAFGQGWVGLFPLQGRTAVVATYDSRQISDQEMIARLSSLAKAPIISDATVSRLEQGMRRRCWVGNCVAIGEAAIALEPLDAVQLHLAHNCISQLMTMFPVDAQAMPEAKLYDGIIRYVGTNLRDFQAAHYKLNHRIGEPMWDRCREAQVPHSLRRKLEIFAARGHVPLYDFETFQEHSWSALFIGHGLIPQSYDPRLDAMPEQDQIASVHQRMQDIIRCVDAMPRVEEFIAWP